MQLTAKQTSDYLGIGLGTIRKMAANGTLPAIKTGTGKVKNHFKFEQSAIRTWKKEHETKKSPRKPRVSFTTIPEGFVTAREASEISGLRDSSLYGRVKSGKLEITKVGARTYFRKDQLVPNLRKNPIQEIVRPEKVIHVDTPGSLKTQLNRIEAKVDKLMLIWS